MSESQFVIGTMILFHSSSKAAGRKTQVTEVGDIDTNNQWMPDKFRKELESQATTRDRK